jgi:hypothetical protein
LGFEPKFLGSNPITANKSPTEQNFNTSNRPKITEEEITTETGVPSESVIPVKNYLLKFQIIWNYTEIFFHV